MFENVIIAIDEQDARKDAIKLAEELVAPGGKLTLVHIHHRSARLRHGLVSAADAGRAEIARAEKLLATARRTTGITSSLTFGASSVGRGLHRLAERRGADLLVVGSTRHGLVGRVLMSDDTREAIKGSPCAVAIAPAGYADQMGEINETGEIGVAYNESSESEHALSVARELGVHHHARVSVFEVVSVPACLTHGVAAPWGDIADTVLREARDRLERLEGVEPHVVFGDVAEELTLYSASTNLLVVGSRDFGRSGRLVPGSTSRRLAHTAHCPLLILTRAEREQTNHPLAATSGITAGV